MKRSSHGLEDFGFSKKATVCDANTVDCESSTNDDTAHIQQRKYVKEELNDTIDMYGHFLDNKQVVFAEILLWKKIGKPKAKNQATRYPLT
mgnify:CR=1 FL=1